MAKLALPEVAIKIAAKLEALGLEVHKEDRNGQSCTRFSVGHRAADPLAVFQGVEGSILLNLPGDLDNIVAGGADLVGLGNSSPGPDSSPT